MREALGLAPAPPLRTRPSVTFSEISTDSRTLRPGALFVALRGERFDGHDHLAAAAKAGAAAAIVRAGTAPVPGLPFIEVDDTLRAYGDLAHARRADITGPVVAITGTNGKTSTKEMLAAVLRTRYRTHHRDEQEFPDRDFPDQAVGLLDIHHSAPKADRLPDRRRGPPRA